MKKKLWKCVDVFNNVVLERVCVCVSGVDLLMVFKTKKLDQTFPGGKKRVEGSGGEREGVIFTMAAMHPGKETNKIINNNNNEKNNNQRRQ